MPTNRHALIRYRTINDCLRRSSRQWTWRELSEACGEQLRYYLGEHIDDPSRRTIFEDIRMMKAGGLGYRAPIAFDRRRQTYYYSDPEFSIANSPLGPEDIEELRHALVILRQFRGFRHMQGIENIIAKLDYQVRRSADPNHSLIQFDHPLDAPGQQWLDQLYHSAYQRRNLQITYHPFDFEEAYTHLFSPYLLREYNRRWFLLAYNHERRRLEKLALDRIREVVPAADSAYEPPHFDPASYFQPVIGVTLPDDGQMEKVVFAVTLPQAHYIITKPLHSSQQVLKEKEGKVLFQLEVMLNYELESRLLSFGERIEVQAPAGLRQRLAERVKALHRVYF